MLDDIITPDTSSTDTVRSSWSGEYVVIHYIQDCAQISRKLSLMMGMS